MKNYIVSVREISVSEYQVMASDEAEAKDLVSKQDSSVKDLGLGEFSHVLDSETWDVNETEGET